MYQKILPILFRFDEENVHKFILSTLKWIPKCCFVQPSEQPISKMGMNFPHPIGLAAGLDKNGKYIDALSKLGFSFIEVGTVTPRPQSGNPKPRLFRLPSAGAIINRMGFNNDGVASVIQNLKKTKYKGILGINIGKNTNTSLNDAVGDYLYCLRNLYCYASYITINISSPNSPNLRLLQQKDYLDQLLTQLIDEQQRLGDKHNSDVPLVVKLSPDESDETLKNIGELILKKRVSGIIISNTTTHPDRTVKTLKHGNEKGGVSGKPLELRATACLKTIKEVVGDEVTLIGCGGIDDVESATQKLKAGASLLQIYTGLIYKGPKLIRDLSQSVAL